MLLFNYFWAIENKMAFRIYLCLVDVQESTLADVKQFRL